MDLRQLRYFVEIAHTGNMREAAHQLRIAQPALSRHVRALEAELGVRLFVRHARGMRLTGPGQHLLAQANDILGRVEHMRAGIRAEGEGAGGRVTVATAPALSRWLFPDLAVQAREKYPAIDLQFTEGGAYALIAGLDSRRVDVAVMIDPDRRSGFVYEVLTTEPVCLIALDGDPGMPTGPLSLTSLRGVPLITYARPSGPRNIMDRAALAAGMSLNVVYSLQSGGVILDFVRRGMGIGLIPYSMLSIEPGLNAFTILPVDGLTISRTLVLREELAREPAADAIAQLVRSRMATLAGDGYFGNLEFGVPGDPTAVPRDWRDTGPLSKAARTTPFGSAPEN